MVRTGRIAEGRVGGSVGAPNSGPLGNPNPGQQQHPMGTGVMLGGEVGPADDLLKVVMTNSEGHGIQVWLSTEEGALPALMFRSSTSSRRRLTVTIPAKN